MAVKLVLTTKCEVDERSMLIRYVVAGPAGAVELRMDFKQEGVSLVLDRAEVHRHAHVPLDATDGDRDDCDVLPSGHCHFNAYGYENPRTLAISLLRGHEAAVWAGLKGHYANVFESSGAEKVSLADKIARTRSEEADDATS